jgi:hypothetical protein
MNPASKKIGERTRPRVQFPASRRKAMLDETPNTTRGRDMLPNSPFSHG